MTIKDEAFAEAERRYQPLRPTGYSEHLTHRKHFIAGAEWQAPQPREVEVSGEQRRALVELEVPLPNGHQYLRLGQAGADAVLAALGGE